MGKTRRMENIHHIFMSGSIDCQLLCWRELFGFLITSETRHVLQFASSTYLNKSEGFPIREQVTCEKRGFPIN